MKMLKVLTVMLVASCISVAAAAQANAIDKYFSQYVNDENFTVVYISPKMFQMIDKLKIDGLDDEEGKAIMDVAKDLRGLRILTTDVNPLKYYKEAKAKINTNEYEILMTVRDKDGENVEFYVKELAGSNGNVFEEFFLLVGGQDEDFVLISFVGKIDLAKISKLAESIESDDLKIKKNEE